MMVTWALFSCQGDIWNLAKQNEHITDHLNGGSVFVLLLIGGEYRDRTGDLLHAMQALSRTVSKHTPTRKCGDGLNIALIRSICQKDSQLHPASRNHAPPTRQFYHPIFKCVNGFCSERRSFTRKVFSDSLLSAILILHIKVALFIFPKNIDKEVFSTMSMYFCCFLSMNQPHDP